MKSRTDIQQKMRAAYMSCRYCLPSEGLEFDLNQKVSHYHRLFEILQCEKFAIISAQNPQGKVQSDMANLSADNILLSRLEDYEYRKIIMKDPQGNWPDEVGNLVKNISQHNAMNLALEFDQLAIVYGKNLMVGLVWTS